MSLSDPIANMLTSIRNATMAKKEVVEVTHSILKSHLARILKREGFITDYVSEAHDDKKVIRLFLKYNFEQEPVIQGLKRISKSGLRHYVSADKVPYVLRGMGVAILTTSYGILTDHDARKKGIGGEVLCHVW
ncbi:MAG: 30S ribosomal protein S8 [Kiritimatiellae bacterium]|nr:30S ribosomal protein S8 [Kiritimatiellia bacterium]